MPALASSNLASADYDAETQTLTITFKSGGAYEYDGVPQAVYDQLLQASSAGQYFMSVIKDAYVTRRI
jgi:hypothetical protein